MTDREVRPRVRKRREARQRVSKTFVTERENGSHVDEHCPSYLHFQVTLSHVFDLENTQSSVGVR